MKLAEKHLIMIEVWNLKRQGLTSLQVSDELGQPLRLVNKLYASTLVQLTRNRPRKDVQKDRRLLLEVTDS